MRPRHRESGFALLVVLWTLGLLALLGTRVVGAGRTELTLAGNLERSARLEALADGAARTALFHRLPGAPPWPADGQWRSDPQAGGAARVALRIIALGGRINPNLAPPEEWMGLFTALGVPREVAAPLTGALIAWRTPGMGDPSTTKYTQTNRDWGPPGTQFESLGELGLVYGMTPELLALLRPHLSLATTLEPDPVLADPVVLHALSLAGNSNLSAGGAAAADRALRAQAYEIEALATDGPARFGRRITVLIDPSDTDHPAHVLGWESF